MSKACGDDFGVTTASWICYLMMQWHALGDIFLGGLLGKTG